MPPSFYVGLFIFMIGVSLTIFTHFKYTKEVHLREIIKSPDDKDYWDWSNLLGSLFTNLFMRIFIWLSKKSYTYAKISLVFICLVITGFGLFLLIDAIIFKFSN